MRGLPEQRTSQPSRRRHVLACAGIISLAFGLLLTISGADDAPETRPATPWQWVSAGAALMRQEIDITDLLDVHAWRLSIPGHRYAQGRATQVDMVSFLESQVGRPRKGRPIWTVIGGGFYLREVVPQLVAYLDALKRPDRTDSFKRPPGPKLGGEPDQVFRKLSAADTPRPSLLVLCLDEACMSTCALSGLMCYIFDKIEDLPERYRESRRNNEIEYRSIGWQKSRALSDLARAGYSAICSDLDVFFQGNIFEYLHDIDNGRFDIQMQDEGGDSLNIGFFAQRGTEAVADLWQSIAHQVSEDDAWDQPAVNEYLGAAELRTGNHTFWPPLSSFTGLTGLQVYVIDKARVWGRTMGWTPPASVVALHLTCTGKKELKVYDAKESAFWQDVDHYYTDPPRILTIGALAGDGEAVSRQLKVMLALANATDRAFVPPSQIYITSDLPGLSDAEFHHFEKAGKWPPTRAQRLADADKTDFELLKKPAVYHRRFASTVDIVKLFNQSAVTIFEPSYLRNALHYSDGDASRLRQRHLDSMLLHSYQHTLETLSSEPYLSAPVVTIMDHNNIDRFEAPEGATDVPMCRAIETVQGCGTLCL
ncbi:uncharacterized protein L969DRAFT_62714 [Mixia osmundae IAM 14324]|uniref:Nucleotide-diphospho-sugar transferase domain-containing protein n=1 Tax=Mixia osmundae (strain CBS 9802 / IAM 14324 / JCM 22182 / KY 12970) TaxID=764103 RepID=G7E4B6_MIXOS|nr:uncharacterized protein L969DRAFT_62714 [Mixia osmundae IAM 14324]KEI39773.1 hypothetical protein L969DRAFT_62714 [Mixia osmundae IAM 14324]GAA97676.1 hypothetical protein E5Q_04354 [Mixia osmundae IAM 14324]